MIVINKKYNSNGTEEPERYLDSDEENIIIARWGQGDQYWYFTVEDIGSEYWTLYQDYINPSLTLDKAKQNKKDEIDKNTQTLIFQGFEYAGLIWSMSLNAQVNWSNLPQISESRYPEYLLSQTDDIYILTYSERMDFYNAALDFKTGHLASGRMLKMQVEAKTSVEEVINFIDNRI